MHTFHISLIRQHIANNDDLFPCHEASSFYSFGADKEQEWLVDEIIAHQWSSPKDLEALDKYLELHGVTQSYHLPWRS